MSFSSGRSPADAGDRYPHEFWGSTPADRTASCIGAEPRAVVCDEPVSALDVSIQAQIINLMEKLQRELGLTYLFIAHDLAVVRHISTRIAVMYLGKIVEVAPADDLYDNPLHPYTITLLAIPIPDPEVERRRQAIRVEGDLPSPANPRPPAVFTRGAHSSSRPGVPTRNRGCARSKGISLRATTPRTSRPGDCAPLAR